MLYGATGYTGRLIAEAAREAGSAPILAARGEAVLTLARTLGLEGRVLSLEQPASLVKALDGIDLLLNCAGPFSATATPWMSACLAARTHYLDITGEIAVFEHARRLDAAAGAAGVVLCPGVGFDVIPTDCLAVTLKQALPDATVLRLGFDARGPASPGTARTSIEGLAQGGCVRRGGQLHSVPLGAETAEIDFGFGSKTAVSIPWGDLATAWVSTGIPDITVYMAVPHALVVKLAVIERLHTVIGWRWVQSMLKHLAGRRAVGPDAAARARLRTAVWGEVMNARGERRVARVETANGYALTVSGALAVVAHVLGQPDTPGGYYTPAMLCGPSLVERLPGSGPIRIDPV
jgi:short subunit dehydrogenase-like uncharacterized protein